MDNFLNTIFSGILGGIIASVIAPFLTEKLELRKKKNEILLSEKIELYKELHSLLNKIFITKIPNYSEQNWNNLTDFEKENIYDVWGIKKTGTSYNDYITKAGAEFVNSLCKNIKHYDESLKEKSLLLSDDFMKKSDELGIIWNNFADHVLRTRKLPSKEMQDAFQLKIKECQDILKNDLKI